MALGLAPVAWAAVTLVAAPRVGMCLVGAVPVRAAALWVLLAVTATARNLSPDLAPRWLGLLADAAAALAVVPAALIGVRIAAVRGRAWSSGAVLAVVGVLVLTGAIVAEGLLQGQARGAVRFTSWDGAGALFPPAAGLYLIAAACVAQATATTGAYRWGRVSAAAALETGMLGAATAWPLGLAESAGGGSAATDSAQAAVRLGWSLGLVVAAAVQLRALTTRSATEGRTEPARPGDTGPPRDVVEPTPPRDVVAPTAWPPREAVEPTAWPPRARTAGFSLLVTAAGLFLFMFVPAAGRPPPAPPTPARYIDPELAAAGRRVYVRDGCAGCHTQRVLPADVARGWGPMTDLSEPVRRAAAGFRRGGPDLAWVGDRYPNHARMAERLAVHGPDGPAAPHSWLFRPSLTVEGRAVAEYLVSLRADGAAE
jgi:cytochrome c oxidase cbb3-type subunit 2